MVAEQTMICSVIDHILCVYCILAGVFTLIMKSIVSDPTTLPIAMVLMAAVGVVIMAGVTAKGVLSGELSSATMPTRWICLQIVAVISESGQVQEYV